MSTLVETLAWLVGIPSPTGSEAAICTAISERLATHPVRLVQESVVIGEPSDDKVLLVGHTDTVPLQGETGARIEGGRLHGLGATDMKGGLAVMIHLIEALGTDGIVGVFYAGEEGPIKNNQLGPILDTIPGLTSAPAGIVLEPSNRELQAGCNGVINATVTFEGEPAHSARPWLGVNAVTRSGPFLTAMDGLEPEAHEVDGLVFKEVMSVTKAAGGIANNVIPGRFELNVNYRFAPDRSIEDAERNFRTVCAPADTIDITDLAPAALPSVDNPLFLSLAETSGAPVTPKQGWTDVAQLAVRGVPAINFGPGETDLAHKPGESVRIADLDWAFESLRQVLS
ncbi:MAG: succinyl-diaminopimelate desuccinylase [Acidimicrobiia bacterium]